MQGEPQQVGVVLTDSGPEQSPGEGGDEQQASASLGV